MSAYVESWWATVYPKKYAHGFVVLCFVVVMQSLIMNSHEVFIHIHQGCFAGTGAIVRLPQCQWSKPDGYGKISQCITTTKHSKAKTVCIFLGIYCMSAYVESWWATWIFTEQFSVQYQTLNLILRDTIGDTYISLWKIYIMIFGGHFSTETSYSFFFSSAKQLLNWF